jgi:hypothetical protein
MNLGEELGELWGDYLKHVDQANKHVSVDTRILAVRNATLEGMLSWLMLSNVERKEL